VGLPEVVFDEEGAIYLRRPFEVASELGLE
jgi:hypothetical protein